MCKGRVLLISALLLIILQVVSGTLHAENATQRLGSYRTDVTFFFPGSLGGVFNGLDVRSYEKIADELGLSTSRLDYSGINKRASFFDKNGKRRSAVLIIPGGIPQYWFMKRSGQDRLICQGVYNILSFIESGGSVICICYCGSMLFVTDLEMLCSTMREIKHGKFDEYRVHQGEGLFKRCCGVYAVNGTLRGPQESNMHKVPGLPPYPRITFLPIKINLEHEIARTANLPSVIHQVVVGGGSIIPHKGQPLDVVGWYPNGTAAIGIAPYGRGRIIMSNPHPNITGRMAEHFKKYVMTGHARNWNWTEEMIAKGKRLIEDVRDPDGPEPDWTLSKAMLSYAYNKASE
jgi:hypothetical protein